MRWDIRKICITLLILVVGCGGVACDSNTGTTQVGNPSSSGSTPSISVSKVSDSGTVIVEMSTDIFGSSTDDLDGATFGIHVNGAVWVTGLDPYDYYVSEDNEVAFVLPNLSEGDDVVFVIHLNSGAVTYYEVVVSSENETTGTLIASE